VVNVNQCVFLSFDCDDDEVMNCWCWCWSVDALWNMTLSGIHQLLNHKREVENDIYLNPASSILPSMDLYVDMSSCHRILFKETPEKKMANKNDALVVSSPFFFLICHHGICLHSWQISLSHIPLSRVRDRKRSKEGNKKRRMEQHAGLSLFSSFSLRIPSYTCLDLMTQTWEDIPPWLEER